ncbi:hypothetical protein BHE74_00031191 [Ensete ventricosum]|nr:hypothetical protein BHE74_00031191 [Ensete ventricosum]
MVEGRRRGSGLLGQQEVLQFFLVAGKERKVVTHAGIAHFDDEVGEPETITDSPSGGSHVPREPVDDAATGVEPHLRDPLAHLRPPTHRRRYTPPTPPERARTALPLCSVVWLQRRTAAEEGQPGEELGLRWTGPWWIAHR